MGLLLALPAVTAILLLRKRGRTTPAGLALR